MSVQIVPPVRSSPVRLTLPTAKPPASGLIDQLRTEDQVLLTKLLTEPAEFITDETFSHADIETTLFGAPARLCEGKIPRFDETSDNWSCPVTGTDRVPILPAAQERRLFLRFNYARGQVVRLLNQSRGKPLSAEATRWLIAWGWRVLTTRGVIVRLNMPLVLAMAKRTRLSSIDFNELISEGNLALLRSIEKFDISRGYKFSTYSCRAILKSFSRVAMRASRYRGKFPTEFDPVMERSDFVDRKRETVESDCVDELKEILVQNLAGLSDVERRVINERFALGPPTQDGTSAPKTLEQVGVLIGVTKERVRQIQNNALRKIRGALEERYLAA